MNKQGKVKQVIFEPALQLNNYTGELEPAKNGFNLWTDEGLKELIEKVEGVCLVFEKVNGLKTFYSLAIDPRYDVEFVKREIEAEIICKIGEI